MFKFSLVAVTWALWLMCAEAQTRPVRVVADRVNLRAAPNLVAEVVAQVNEDDELEALTIQDDWVEVRPPDTIDFWVHRDFIENDQITSKKLNVRSGPGINYLVVGELTRDDIVNPRGEFGEWLRIAPPPHSSLWISSEFVESIAIEEEAAGLASDLHEQFRAPVLTEPAPERPSPSSPSGLSAPRAQDEAASPLRRPRPQMERSIPLPPEWKLIPLEGQGKLVDVEGTLRAVGFMQKKPTRYRLVREDLGRAQMVCYVRGNDEQLAEYAGRTLILTGREYWIQGYDYPALVVEKIKVPSSLSR